MDNKFNKIRLVYYSGTGGTRIAAECFARQLRDLGQSVVLQRLKAGEPEATGDFDLLLVLYAVYAFNAPEPVYDWINRIPEEQGKPAAVISVSGGGEMSPNTACRVKTIKMLEKKGYQVMYENMLVMPSNIAIATKAPLDKMLLDILPQKVSHMIAEINRGKMRRTNPHLLDRALASMGHLERFGAHSFGKRIRVSESCNGCGLCAESCTSGNITMNAGNPTFDSKCFLCMNCFYTCPQKALRPGIGKMAVLKVGLDLDKLAGEPPAAPMTAEQLNAAAPGFAWSGVRKYISED